MRCTTGSIGRDTLEAAWERVRANQGAPGVDEETIAEIEALPAGVKGFLDDLQESLRAKSYTPKIVLISMHISKIFEECLTAKITREREEFTKAETATEDLA